MYKMEGSFVHLSYAFREKNVISSSSLQWAWNVWGRGKMRARQVFVARGLSASRSEPSPSSGASSSSRPRSFYKIECWTFTAEPFPSTSRGRATATGTARPAPNVPRTRRERTPAADAGCPSTSAGARRLSKICRSSATSCECKRKTLSSSST